MINLRTVDFDDGCVEEDDTESSNNQVNYLHTCVLNRFLVGLLSLGPVDGQWWTSDVGSLVIHGTLGAALSRRWKALATVFFSASLRSLKTDALLIQALMLLQGRVYNYDDPSGSFHGFSFQSPQLRPGVSVVKSCKCWARVTRT